MNIFTTKLRSIDGSTENTLAILHSISSHLSNRDEVKNKNYSVTITPGGNVFFNSQLVYVYRDANHRKDSDKSDIITHVLSLHFADISCCVSDGHWRLAPKSYVPGTYYYAATSLSNRRRWQDEVTYNRYSMT